MTLAGQEMHKINLITGVTDVAKVLGKLSVPGRPTNLNNSRARAYCTCSGCGFGDIWTFFLSSVFSVFFLSLWETVRYRLQYYHKGPFNQINRPTNKLTT